MPARLSFLFAFLLASPAAAEQEPQPPPPDFSAGFNHITNLGLHPLDATAVWSTLPENLITSDHQTRQALRSLKGNGWLIPSADLSPLILPAGTVKATPLDAARIAGASSRGFLGRKTTPDDKPPKIPKADIEKDINALIKTIRKADPDENRFGRSGRLPAGTFLILATQVHQAGHTSLANQLATALFDSSPSRETIIDAAIDTLADHSYQNATRSFFESGDWTLFHKTINELMEKFPRGWSSREAVAIFMPQLAKQASGEQAPTPSLTDITISPQATQAIQDLSKPPAKPSTPPESLPSSIDLGGMDIASLPPEVRAQLFAMGGASSQFDFSSLWLLSPPEKPEDSSPLNTLTSLGTAALPALAALLDDPFLIPLPNPQSTSRSSYFSSNESESDRIMRIHSSMNRPASRGEIARILLIATLPDSANDLDEADPETLRELTIDFWKLHRESPVEKLAIAFLRDGSSSQANTASTILAKSSDPAAHQALESHILSTDPAIGQFQNVRTYLSARKATAKPFFDQYVKLVRSQTPEKTKGDNDDDDSFSSAEDFEASWRIKQAGGPAKILKQLEALVAGKSPRAIAKEIANGDPIDAETNIEGLVNLLNDASPLKKLYALLEGAVSSDSPEIRCLFLSAASDIDWPDPENLTQDTPPQERTLPEAEIKVWKKLFADSRKPPAKFASPSIRSDEPAGETTIGDIAISTFISNISDEFHYSLYRNAPILQKSLPALFREQALARVDGKPIPPLPDPSSVTPERLKSIIAEAASKPVPEIHTYLSTLSPDERAAWATWTSDSAASEIPDAIKQLRFLVTNASSESHLSYAFPDAPESDLFPTGFILNHENLLSIFKTLQSEPAKHSRTTVVFTPTPFGPGLATYASIIPIPEPGNAPKDEDTPFSSFTALNFFQSAIQELDQVPNSSAILSLSLQSTTTGSFRGSWTLENNQLKPTNQELPKKLEEALKQIAESDDFQRISLQLQFITRDDATKIQQNSPEE